MTCFKWTVFCLTAAMATAVGSAQQKFPLRSGEWAATTADPVHPGGEPMTMLFCLNDATWTKALSGNPTCQLQQFVITPIGGSYSIDCPAKAFQMKGRADLSFDGMTHMISKGSFDVTINGKTSHMDSTSDYRWKGSVCNPAVDMNLKFDKHN